MWHHKYPHITEHEYMHVQKCKNINEMEEHLCGALTSLALCKKINVLLISLNGHFCTMHLEKQN